MFAPLDRADLKPVIACTFYCTTGIISGLIVPYNELANALPPPIPSMGFNPPTIEPLRSSEWSSAQLDIACTSLDAVLTQSATRPRTARRKRPCVHENDTEPQASPSQPAEHHHLRCLNDGTAMAVAAPPPPPLQPVAGSAMDSMDPLMQCSWRRCGEHVSRNTAWGHFQATHCGVYKCGDMRNHHMEQHCHE
ncbi:hypothetical protein AcV7_009199 [Taiwanofungus camphoratus]|nr:hypothetical protein AcV7_009199 [Antrodia cinnamomea]